MMDHFQLKDSVEIFPPPPQKKKLNCKNSTYSNRKFKNKNSKIAPTVTENEINDLNISFNVDQGFPYWDDGGMEGGSSPPPTSQKFAHPPSPT